MSTALPLCTSCRRLFTARGAKESAMISPSAHPYRAYLRRLATHDDFAILSDEPLKWVARAMHIPRNGPQS
jgi:hypothetical protein